LNNKGKGRDGKGRSERRKGGKGVNEGRRRDGSFAQQ